MYIYDRRNKIGRINWKSKKGNIEAFTQLIMNLENDLNFYSLLKQLKYEERIVIILYYMEQYSVKDIKDILHMNENTIRANLSPIIQITAEKSIEKMNTFVYCLENNIENQASIKTEDRIRNV